MRLSEMRQVGQVVQVKGAPAARGEEGVTGRSLGMASPAVPG
jgi:hypothetical protein